MTVMMEGGKTAEFADLIGIRPASKERIRSWNVLHVFVGITQLLGSKVRIP